MRKATNLKQRAAMVLQALVLCGLFVVAALSAGEQAAHAGDAAVAHDRGAVTSIPKG